MKKSWFITIVIIITIVLIGIGVYFFFPSVSKKIAPIIDPSLFGELVDENGNIITQPTNTPNNNPDNPDTTETPADALPGFKAFKIGDYEVASVQPIDFKVSATETTTLLLSVGKGSGVVRLYDPKIGSTSIIGTISIPNIIRSEFTSNGTYVVVQSQESDSLKTFVLKNDPRTPIEERFFTPIFSSSSIDSFFIDGNTVYFVEKTKTGADIYEYVPSLNKRNLIFRGIFNNIYSFAQNGTIFIGTKPASGAMGFIFKLDKTKGLVNKIASGTALVGVSGQNGDKVITTEFFDSTSTSKILNSGTKQTSNITIKTNKEKCTPNLSTKTIIFCAGTDKAFEKGPDAWYMGAVSLSDSLYFIDQETNEVSFVTTTDEPVDVIYPQSSLNQEYLPL